MKTKSGIYLNIKESEYKYCVDNFIFYFSSQFYLNKFKNSFEKYIDNETMKLETKYNEIINCYVFLLINYYKKIEKRGFYVMDKMTGKEIKKEIPFIISIANYRGD